MPRALIIDDDHNNLGVLAQMLELSNVDYTAIQDPTEVEPLLRTNTHFDIVILDLEMPNLDGYQLFEMLQQSHMKGIPVVACTVHTSEITTARDMGFHSFLAKPLNVDEFPQQLAHILAGKPVWVAN